MLELGTHAPDFHLNDTQGHQVSRDDFTGKPLLVVFMCNHCPYVKHIAGKLAQLTRDYQEHGVAVVGINSNDADNYPDDSPAKMIDEVTNMNYTFAYLYDGDQTVAKAYKAACTPDFFLFDSMHKLAYRGQFDDARPGNDLAVNGADLNAAVNALVCGEIIPTVQKPSMGCNIKWKAGNEPDYYG